jgi:hypothetical protein
LFKSLERRKCVRMDLYLETSPYRLHQSCILRRSNCRLWDLRAVCLLKTSLKRLHPSRFLPWPGCRKWVRMALRHLQTTLRWLQNRRFLRRPEGRFRVPSALRLHASLNRLRPSSFLTCNVYSFRCPGCRKWVGMAFDTLKRRFKDFT